MFMSLKSSCYIGNRNFGCKITAFFPYMQVNRPQIDVLQAIWQYLRVKFYKSNVSFNFWMVVLLRLVILATLRTEYPLRSRVKHSLYSSRIWSLLLFVPLGLPNPASASVIPARNASCFFFSLASFRRNLMLSLSMAEQVAITATKMAKNGFSLPSMNNDICSFWK